MDEHTHKHISFLLRQALDAIRTHNYLRLRELSDQTVHTSTVMQDDIHISISVILYSLFKIYEKNTLRNTTQWNTFNEKIQQGINKAYQEINKQNIKKFSSELKQVQEQIKSYESDFGIYIREALEQAKVQKGSRVVEHGISTGRAAELLGVSQWELQSYIGATRFSDLETSVSPKKRIEYTRSLFP